MNNLRLRLPASELMTHCKDYTYPVSDKPIMAIGEAVRRRGWMEPKELVEVERWKNPRFAGRVESNSPDFITETTATSLRTTSERLRIESLTLLDGVGWPVASVILHFCHAERYPLLDARALWTLGIDKLPAVYDFNFWWSYVSMCRNLADHLQTDMRSLDRALWGYSKLKGEMARA